MVMVNDTQSSCQHLPLRVEPQLPLRAEPQPFERRRAQVERGEIVAISPDAGFVTHILIGLHRYLAYLLRQAPPTEQTVSLAVTGIG